MTSGAFSAEPKGLACAGLSKKRQISIRDGVIYGRVSIFLLIYSNDNDVEATEARLLGRCRSLVGWIVVSPLLPPILLQVRVPRMSATQDHINHVH